MLRYFLAKGLRLVSPQWFVYGFSRKMFVKLYSINWPNLIFWLLPFLYILGNLFVEIICFPAFDVINFKINFSFLIKPFIYIISNIQIHKNSNILRTKRAFIVKQKAFSISFKGSSITRNYLRPESGPSKVS